jgi:prefoldin subunit 5
MQELIERQIESYEQGIQANMEVLRNKMNEADQTKELINRLQGAVGALRQLQNELPVQDSVPEEQAPNPEE